MPLANVGAGRTQEIIGKPVPGIGIADTHRAWGLDALGQVLALVDIEDRVFAQHRDDVGRGPDN